MHKKCIKCKTRNIQQAKHNLCNPCYQKERKEGRLRLSPGISTPTIQKYKHLREMDFIKNFFTHTNWTAQPCVFSLGIKSYRPDFYDGERNVFIEVAGTKQAYHANKEKYAQFRRLFPKLILEIRLDSGELLEEDVPRLKWQKALEAQNE